jgi:hypothetical protein
MSMELTTLAPSGLPSLTLALPTPATQGVTSSGSALHSNRETFPVISGFSGREVRAHANLNEALLLFAICSCFLDWRIELRLTEMRPIGPGCRPNCLERRQTAKSLEGYSAVIVLIIIGPDTPTKVSDVSRSVGGRGVESAFSAPQGNEHPVRRRETIA